MNTFLGDVELVKARAESRLSEIIELSKIEKGGPSQDCDGVSGEENGGAMPAQHDNGCKNDSSFEDNIQERLKLKKGIYLIKYI